MLFFYKLYNFEKHLNKSTDKLLVLREFSKIPR